MQIPPLCQPTVKLRRNEGLKFIPAPLHCDPYMFLMECDLSGQRPPGNANPKGSRPFERGRLVIVAALTSVNGSSATKLPDAICVTRTSHSLNPLLSGLTKVVAQEDAGRIQEWIHGPRPASRDAP